MGYADAAYALLTELQAEPTSPSPSRHHPSVLHPTLAFTRTLVRCSLGYRRALTLALTLAPTLALR